MGHMPPSILWTPKDSVMLEICLYNNKHFEGAFKRETKKTNVLIELKMWNSEREGWEWKIRNTTFKRKSKIHSVVKMRLFQRMLYKYCSYYTNQVQWSIIIFHQSKFFIILKFCIYQLIDILNQSFSIMLLSWHSTVTHLFSTRSMDPKYTNTT